MVGVEVEKAQGEALRVSSGTGIDRQLAYRISGVVFLYPPAQSVASQGIRLGWAEKPLGGRLTRFTRRGGTFALQAPSSSSERERTREQVPDRDSPETL